MKTITVRLPDDAYDAVKQHAEGDQVSMNAWIEGVLDQEDMRRRCAAHERWMQSSSEARALAENCADQYVDVLARR